MFCSYGFISIQVVFNPYCVKPFETSYSHLEIINSNSKQGQKICNNSISRPNKLLNPCENVFQTIPNKVILFI